MHSRGFLRKIGGILVIYSRLSLSRSRRDPLKYVEISVLRHISLNFILFVQITHIHTNTFHDIHYSYKRDSEESHDDFFKSVSHNICVANFRPMININYLH